MTQNGERNPGEPGQASKHETVEPARKTSGIIMRRYAPIYHAVCPQYQAPGNIEKRDTQGMRPYALCVFASSRREYPETKWSCPRPSEHGAALPLDAARTRETRGNAARTRETR